MSINQILQIIIALGLLNVWLVRSNKKSEYRGGSANNIKDEFKAYGLPSWFVYLIGFKNWISLGVADWNLGYGACHAYGHINCFFDVRSSCDAF
jgi:hypothetical protein